MVEIMVPVSTQAVQTSARFLGLTPKKWLVYGGVVIVSMAAGYAVYRFVKNRSTVEKKDQLQKKTAKLLKEDAQILKDDTKIQEYEDRRQKAWDALILKQENDLVLKKTQEELAAALKKLAEIEDAEVETEYVPSVKSGKPDHVMRAMAQKKKDLESKARATATK